MGGDIFEDGLLEKLHIIWVDIVTGRHSSNPQECANNFQMLHEHRESLEIIKINNSQYEH
jgi:hypothetical protein